MSGPNEPTSLSPLPDPDEDPVAGTLADVLTSEAGRIDPGERLDRIRDAVAQPHRRWLPLVAGAAAVALVAGGAWAAIDHDPDHRSGAPTAPVSSPTPRLSPTPAVSATPSPTGPVGSPVTVPVYYLGTNVKGLFREFQRTTVPAKDQERTVEQALRLAVDPAAPKHPGDTSPWLAGTSAALRAEFVNTEQLFVLLPTDEEQTHGRTAEQARLAAQQLVWTATATLQDPRLSVRILFGNSPGRLFGSLSTKPLFHRPPSAESYVDLAAIWILQPADGATVPGPVTFSGQACTFEANVAWQVLSGPVGSTTVVRSGRTTATSGCPQRGTWSVKVAGLPAGAYTFRAYELSAKGDGSYEGLDSTTFIVR
jgi:Immunoglobulin-like domain of bacterial spore germination